MFDRLHSDIIIEYFFIAIVLDYFPVVLLEGRFWGFVTHSIFLLLFYRGYG